MSHCTQCGAELQPGEKFCARCGHPVAPTPSQPPGDGGALDRTVIDGALSAYLEVRDGPQAGQTYPLSGTACLLGRARNNDIVVPDAHVSGCHARIEVSPQGCVLSDAGSTNGTYLNGQRIAAPQLLREGDQIRIGGTVYLFHSLSPTQSRAVQTPAPQPLPPVPPPPAAYAPPAAPAPAAKKMRWSPLVIGIAAALGGFAVCALVGVAVYLAVRGGNSILVPTGTAAATVVTTLPVSPAATASYTPTALPPLPSSTRPPTATPQMISSATPPLTATPQTTAQPTAARSGAEPAGLPVSLLLEERFDDESGGWPAESDENAVKEVRDGAYRISVMGDNWQSWSLIPDRAWADVDLELDVQQVGEAEDGAWGVLLRYTDKDNWVRVSLSPQGTYEIAKRAEGAFSPIQAWTRSDAIRTGQESNHLRVACAGQEIAVWVNNQHLATVRDRSHRSGQVALLARTFTGKGPVQAAFDNLRLSTPGAIPPADLVPLPYVEEFEDAEGGWPASTEESVDYGPRDGAYAFAYQKPNLLYRVNLPGRVFADLDAAVDVQTLGGPAEAYTGLVFRYVNQDNQYMLRASADGRVRVDKKVGGEYVALLPWTESDAVRQGQATNRLRAVCVGALCRAYVNGEQVHAFEDETFMQGRIGFVVGNPADEGGIEARFDHLEVRLPAPLSAAPAPRILTLPFIDTFSNPDSGWETGATASWVKEYRDGAYHMDLLEASRTAISFAPGEVDDFTLQVTVIQVNDQQNGAGVTFRWQDPRNFYRAEIASNGQFHLYKVVDGVYIPFVPWVQSDVLVAGPGSNRLKVTCAGDRISLSANDRHLATVSDGAHQGGGIALVARSFTDKPDAQLAFDDLRLDPPEALAEYTPAPVQDQFDDPESGWPAADTETATQAYRDGAYTFLLKSPGQLGRAMLAGEIYGDLTLSVDATLTAGPEKGQAGLVYRYVDSSNYYMVRVSGDGQVDAYRLLGGEWKVLLPKRAAPAIRAGAGTTNRLQVACTGAECAASVNGEQVGAWIDGAFLQGRVGLLVGNPQEETGTAATFDAFEIGPPPARPDAPWVAAYGLRGENHDLVLYRADGGATVDLTHSAQVSERNPEWSPDGRWIAYLSNAENPNIGLMRQLWVMRADGSGARNLMPEDTDDVRQAFWSPDGRRLAAEMQIDGPPVTTDVVVIDVEGAWANNLTRSPGIWEWTPRWSPDGQWIAYTGIDDESASLYLIRPDGRGLIRLTGPETDDYLREWSPNGRALLFTRQEDRDGDDEPDRAALWTLDVVSGEQRALTDGAGLDWDGAWSPDGARIAFSRLDGAAREVYVMNADGSGAAALTDTPDGGFSRVLHWSSDGRRLAITREEGDLNGDGEVDYKDDKLCVVNVDGGGLICLSAGPGEDFRGRFQP